MVINIVSNSDCLQTYIYSQIMQYLLFFETVWVVKVEIPQQK